MGLHKKGYRPTGDWANGQAYEQTGLKTDRRQNGEVEELTEDEKYERKKLQQKNMTKKIRIYRRTGRRRQTKKRAEQTDKDGMTGERTDGRINRHTCIYQIQQSLG